jgi:pimeloyl-ACP methyl ester carboxylesterase
MTNTLITARGAFLAEHPERRTQIGGRDWGTIRVGKTGPALILIPGTLGRADIFWQQMVALSGKARILALSYPETGGIAEWAGDIATMITDESLEGAVVLGSSLGGYLAQYLTAQYPAHIGGLVAANTLASTVGIDQMSPYKFDLINTPIQDLRAGFTGGLQTWVDPANPYCELAGLLLAEVAGRIPEAELRARLQAMKKAPELAEQTLPKIAIFTVESDDDHLISPPMRAALRRALDPGRSFRFRTASHFPYVTNPKDYTAMLCEILGLEPAGSHWPSGQESVL